MYDYDEYRELDRLLHPREPRYEQKIFAAVISGSLLLGSFTAAIILSVEEDAASEMSVVEAER